MGDLGRLPKNLSAMTFARAGFRVLPVPPNEKGPNLPEWQHKATTDRAQIEKWWEENPNYNIGLLADGFLVVDIDVTNGGLENWHALTELLEPPPTFTVKTPRGGYHLRYSLPEGEQVGNPRDHPARGIDIRGQAGQSLAPGSDIHGKPYRILTEPENGIVPLLPRKRGELPIAVYAPEWLIRMCGKPVGKKSELAGIRLNEETENTVEAAIDYLQNRAPIAVQGEGGDGTTYQVAADLGDIGVELDTAHHLMLEEWNDRCDPPWDPDDLRVKVESGYRNRQNGIGIKNPDIGDKVFEGVDFGPGEEASIGDAPAEVQLKAALPPKKGFLTFEQSCQLALRGRDPLIDKVLYAGDISVTYGDSGARKSMMMMDMFFHIARGLEWHGHKCVEQTAAFWVAAEGGLSAHLRMRALMKHYRPEEPVPFGILEQPINLLRNAKDTLYLIDEIKRARDHYKQEIGLLEVDTYNAVASGSDEGVSDTGMMMEQFRLIRERIGRHLHINVTHHTGKDLTRGMRGSSSLRAGLEATIEVRKDHRRAGTAWLRKARDGESDVELLRFEAKDIDIGPDEKGRPLHSQVIVPRVVSGMAEVEKNVSMERPWEEMGISESTYWRRKRQGKLEVGDSVTVPVTVTLLSPE